MAITRTRTNATPGFNSGSAGSSRSTATPARPTTPATPLARLTQLWAERYAKPTASTELTTLDAPSTRTLALFVAPFSAAETTAQQQLVLDRARRHYVINTDGPLDTKPPSTEAQTKVEAELLSYARELGYADTRINPERMLLLRPTNTTIDLRPFDGKSRSPEQWLREVGRTLNVELNGIKQVVPPTRPHDIDAKGINFDNALLSTHLSALAYRDRPQVEQQLTQIGFNMSTFRWLEDAATDTRGFVVANAKGEVFTVFRGTSSMENFKTDVMALPVSPSWNVPAGTQVHHGFNEALDAVWPQLEKALKENRATGMFFAGHSLGGALAQLAAVRAVNQGLARADTQLYTQGSPRVGNETFKRFAEKLVPNSWRIVNQRDGWVGTSDPVAAVPPKWLGFRHAGNLLQVDARAVRVIDASSPMAAMAPVPRSALESMPMTESSFTPSRNERDAADATTESLRGEELANYYERLFAEGPFEAPEAVSFGPRPAAAPLPHPARGGVALESISVPRWTGVPLHFLSGYLQNVGDEVLRRIDKE